MAGTMDAGPDRRGPRQAARNRVTWVPASKCAHTKHSSRPGSLGRVSTPATALSRG